jgi:hypothetical protein
MGQLKTDGRAVNVPVVPAGQYNFGELFRINGWNGIALKTIATADTLRAMAMEVSSERVWYFSIPAAVAAAQGAYLYWTTGGTTKRGDTDLQAAVNGAPVLIVEEAKDGNNIIAARVLNVGIST